MAATLFDATCDELERTTGLDRLVLRGTVRLALKSVGLDPSTLTQLQLGLVAKEVLPAELEKRGVTEAGRICADLVARLAATDAGSRAEPESPDEIFRRLSAR